MIEFVWPDLVESEIYERLNACREKTIRSKRSDKIRQIPADALRGTSAALLAIAPKLPPTHGSTIHATFKRSLMPLSARERPRPEVGPRHRSTSRVSLGRESPAYQRPSPEAATNRYPALFKSALTLAISVSSTSGILRISYFAPLGTRSSSFTNETTSAHGMELPCVSLESTTTHLRCFPSKVTVTSAREAAGTGAPEGLFADCPQPATNMETAAEATIARTRINGVDIVARGLRRSRRVLLSKSACRYGIATGMAVTT
jgi:hypothetical protein